TSASRDRRKEGDFVAVLDVGVHVGELLVHGHLQLFAGKGGLPCSVFSGKPSAQFGDAGDVHCVHVQCVTAELLPQASKEQYLDQVSVYVFSGVQWPRLPPVFSCSLVGPMTMAGSTALHMS